ncbi:uncharacterized protein ACNS7B_011852 isoform 1-T1 [Menidia menidia]
MSWAEEDWTVGLPGRVLQKVKELQIHKERLSRENKQKQLQLDNIHTSLEKQTGKYEEIRGELQAVQRELQSVREEAKAAVTSRERLNQDLHTRQAQICSLEGQLDSARTLNNKLTQEVKRLEAELEKLQNSSRSADTTLFSTPCWSSTSPWEPSGSRQEERSGHRDERQSRELHIRRLQFSDPTASVPRQQHKSTPHRHPSDHSDTFSTPSSVFPWERDDSKPASRRRLPPSPQTPGPDATNQDPQEPVVGEKEKVCKTEAEVCPPVHSPEIQSRVLILEDQLSETVRTLKSIQSEMVQTKKELAAKELGLQRARDELSSAHTRMAQESERASGAEQRLKQLQEELKCQRQNAESCRLQHLQRTKDLEKQHQRDLTELQKERQCSDKQHQQEVNKLNQELQQARTLHNALQAQADKLSLQKQALSKDLDSVKEKLKWTEEQLKESQKKEGQTQAKLTEAVREAEGVAVSLEQSRKRERALEEEGRRLLEEQADTLRQIKELQNEKSVLVAPPQPVQFCPVAQSFPLHSSSTPSPRPPASSKRSLTTQAEQNREQEGFDGRRPEVTASYPTDREPGEGIDAEHITVITNSESLPRVGQTSSCDVSQKNRGEDIKADISGTPITSAVDGCGSAGSELSSLPQSLTLSAGQAPLKSEQNISSEDLKRENNQLRSEICDVREELQRRLDDLETQRRAEAEARTRLKLLSRKNASQAVEREERDRELKAQLENEKAETERLRKTITALEAEIRRGREEEKNTAQDDKESEMIEFNIQLKNQLAEVKAQLALEREERKREEEDRNLIISRDADVKKEMSMKLAELKAEMEDFKHGGQEWAEEEKLSAANSPLTYLTLHDNELNSTDVYSDNKLLPSPEQHLLFCQSTNKLNMLMSTAAPDIIQEEQTMMGEQSPLLHDAHTASEDTQQNKYGRSSVSDRQISELPTSDLAKEVEHLQRECSKEAERANQYQAKLEALQCQVTRQTQQLTMAFENQSQHISGLLTELQEKERALQCQAEEVLRYKQELEALKTENHKEGKTTVKDGEEVGSGKESLTETSKQEKECAVSFPTEISDNDCKIEGKTKVTKIEIYDAETAAATDSGETVISESSVDSNTSYWHSDSAIEVTESPCGQNGGAADIVTERCALKGENQQLIDRTTGVTASHSRNPTLQTDSENQEALSTPSCAEQETRVMPNDARTQGQESLQENEDRSENLGGEERRSKSDEDLDAESDALVDLLHQQVEALQMKVRSLSEETQQQAQEIAMWRLASQPAPTTPEQMTAATLSSDELPDIQTGTTGHTQPPVKSAQKTQDSITVVREDELFICCSSSKLQGRMLLSRLQSSNPPEAESPNSSEKTTKMQESRQNAAEINQKSEKPESFPCQCKSKRETKDVAKDPLKPLGPNHAKAAEFYSEEPEAKPNSFILNSEINASETTDQDEKTEMRSVSTQTEDSLYPHRAPTKQTEEEEGAEEELVESPPVSPIPVSDKVESGDRMLFSGSFPIPADPARLAERIRRNRTQLSAAYDDTEYEPYGLPEVVMKGFADIPSGPSCPYIVRRGLLGTVVVPRSQKDRQKEEEETD